MRKLFSFALIALIGLLVTGTAWAETVSQTFEHKLGMNAPAQSWEHRIELTEGQMNDGLFFVRRALTLTGKLEIESEELKGNYYYVKVWLPKTFWGTKGALTVNIEALDQTPSMNPPAAPTDLKISGKSDPMAPTFTWKGLGKCSAVTLYDVTTNQTVWERIAVNALQAEVSGSLKIGHHYKWAVKQSDENAKYSLETQAGFRLETRWETCMTCRGSGWVTCSSCHGAGGTYSGGANGQPPVYHPCSFCHGSGRQRCNICLGHGQVERPIIIVE